MSDGEYFLWVDFATRGLLSFRNNVVHVGDLCWLSRRYGDTVCFSTYFLSDGGLPERVGGNGHSVSGKKEGANLPGLQHLPVPIWVL